jgi:hypothetical protein
MYRSDHRTHLRDIFLHCRFYHIRLNPHKCVFYVESSRLLGFIVSRQGIRVDPLKVRQSSISLLLLHFASYKFCKGRKFFLRHFIPNYAQLTLKFTRLLKKGFAFIWDSTANKAFEALKLTLTRTLLLFPPDYSQDYFLYLVASNSTIAMVLVQEDYSHDEHVIYYLSQSLMTTETKYLHVEKLALAAVQAIQRFRHYIFLRKTTVISNCNPMKHILT